MARYIGITEEIEEKLHIEKTKVWESYGILNYAFEMKDFSELSSLYALISKAGAQKDGINCMTIYATMPKSAMYAYAEFVDHYYYYDIYDANDTELCNIEWILEHTPIDMAIEHLEEVREDFLDSPRGLMRLDGILSDLKAEKALNVA